MYGGKCLQHYIHGYIHLDDRGKGSNEALMRLMAIVMVNIRQMREYDVTYGIVAKARNALTFNI